MAVVRGPVRIDAPSQPVVFVVEGDDLEPGAAIFALVAQLNRQFSGSEEEYGYAEETCRAIERTLEKLYATGWQGAVVSTPWQGGTK